MLRKLIVTLLALAFGVVVLSAADSPTIGKVVAVDGTKIQMTVAGTKPVWLKKGAVVKLTNAAGKVIESAAKVAEMTDQGITVILKEAAEVKAGDDLTLQKGRAMTGC
jgi:hypothetical protein